jgi:mono/diheme cytochrome c family protein
MTGILLAALLVGVLSACVGRPPDDASGEEIYIQLCANCHGDALEGAVGPALGRDSNSASQPDEFLQVTITQGRGRMPSFQSSLSDQQVDLLIGFIRQEQGQ